jgi:hypothetical protein
MNGSTSHTNFEELMTRESSGIHISLLWDRDSNRAVVAVFDASAESSFQLEVGSDSALDVFHHPYAYEAFRVGDSTQSGTPSYAVASAGF